MLGREDNVIEGVGDETERSEGSSSGSVEKLQSPEADGAAKEITVT